MKYLRMDRAPDADARLRECARKMAHEFFRSEYHATRSVKLYLRTECNASLGSGSVPADAETDPAATPIVYSDLPEDDERALAFALAYWLVVDGGAPLRVPTWPLERKWLATKLSAVLPVDAMVAVVLVVNRPVRCMLPAGVGRSDPTKKKKTRRHRPADRFPSMRAHVPDPRAPVSLIARGAPPGVPERWRAFGPQLRSATVAEVAELLGWPEWIVGRAASLRRRAGTGSVGSGF